MRDIEKTGTDSDALGRQSGDTRAPYICTHTVDKLAWRSRISTEQSMAILQAAGMAGRTNDGR